MKSVFSGLLIISLAAFISCTGADNSPLSQVHVFNGTGFHGHTYPGATTPFGLVQLSPDTRIAGWDGCSGYHYSDSLILGFSHTHLSGTGCADLGDFLFTPGLDGIAPLPLDHRKESAEPGYYKVDFPQGISVELTATPRVGAHRYTFTGKGERLLMLDAVHCIGEGSRALVSTLEASGDREVSGHRQVMGWSEGRDIYLSAWFSVPFKSARQTEEGKLLLAFPEDTKELVVYAGLSGTGPEGARANRLAETAEPSFNRIRALASAMWGQALGSISVKGGPTEQFYTCLYHTLKVPNRMDDVDGLYRNHLNRNVHVSGASHFYSTLSIWDTFRSWNPLQTLLNPSLVGDMVNSMLDMFDCTGELPIWPLGNRETYTMIGYHSVSVIADAWLSGIRSFDGEKALQAMVASSNRYKGTNVSTLYTTYGYIPANLVKESVSQTLEFAYDDWCIARMAEDLGHEDIARAYDRRARNYRNVFDSYTGFMRGRNSDGSWVSPFDPIASTRDYTEAIPWQARFFVPQDVAGHTQLMGGREPMLAALDSLFTYEERSSSVKISDITGYLGQYAHGNEPSHHMAYIFTWLGAPHRTQETVRELLSTMYDTTPEGVCGNEDCGQMSAWYVLASLGMYPACPGSGEYILTVPLFREASLRLGNGKTLSIKTDNPKNPYIAGVTLNGEPVARNFLRYAEIMEGGELCFKTSASPDHTRDNLEAPYSLTKGKLVSTPSVKENLTLFKGETTVTLGCRTEGAVIRYTLDGTDPGPGSPLYQMPFTITESCPVKARAFLEGWEPSPLASLQATKAYYYPSVAAAKSKHGVSYSYFRGHFSCTADVLASRAAASGTMPEPSIGQAPDEDHFGYVFTGLIDVPSEGIWDFTLVSDDGAVLDIDGVRVVDNDGSHSALATFGRIPLKKGLHRYRLIYLEDYEGQELRWAWRAEGEKRFSPIPKENLYLPDFPYPHYIL